MPEGEAAEPKQKKSKKLMPALIVAGLMLVEGGAIFAAMKLLGGSTPATADAAEATGEDQAAEQEQPDAETGEVTIANMSASNSLTGRLNLYHIEVSATVALEKQETVAALVEEREATIRDRVNRVIRGADPAHLGEPGLETIRRQIKFELDKAFGDDSLILELLIPKLMQSRGSL